MDVLTATIFVSLILVLGGLVLFVWRLRAGDFEHGDRLSLSPLDDDEGLDDDQESEESDEES